MSSVWDWEFLQLRIATHHGHLSPQLHPLGGVPSSGRDHILKSISYRRRRAKQRKIFLTTYKLDSFTEPESPKLNNVALKFKKIVASVLKLVQTKAGSFRFKSSLSTTDLWRFGTSFAYVSCFFFFKFQSITSLFWLLCVRLIMENEYHAAAIYSV